MTRVLLTGKSDFLNPLTLLSQAHSNLTGGSGFIAAHVLDILLERGYSVVTTVRSLQKAQAIKEAHPTFNKDKLDFAIVEDIAQIDGALSGHSLWHWCQSIPDLYLAFDQAVISDPPFGAVIHTASPYHFNATDVKKELLDPGIVALSWEF